MRRTAERINYHHSYSRKGCPYDNEGIESFHALLKKEHVSQRPIYQTFEEARRKFSVTFKDFITTTEFTVL
ncbi:transposase [Enterococcus faecium]|uniref:Transposase n=1 Tax=Enterococcus faecium TaxID=1352 RepID=A0A6B3Q8C5_ENTFC|nr:transposase [Enterococcus faecium]NEU41016.1 transposase [Enterococcus faecium]NEU43956.1 transposase [Enterococcus faecium]NEU46490.1 transposase [Enterococcus faecium]